MRSSFPPIDESLSARMGRVEVVSRFLETMRGEHHGSELYNVFTARYQAEIMRRIKGGDPNFYMDGRWDDMATNYAVKAEPRRGVDGSVIIELERRGDLSGYGLRETVPPRFRVELEDDQWLISAMGADVPDVIEVGP